jgi:type IV pilus assembly protein PilW
MACRACPSESGFSLIELMVGLTVGLIFILLITQTLAVFEGQKRTTTSGSDAQQSGLLALFAIEQDALKAGGGFTASLPIKCANFRSYYAATSSSAPTPPSTGTVPGGFVPIPLLALDGGTSPGANSDQIIIRSVLPLAGPGSTLSGAIPTRLLEDMPASAATFDLKVERAYDFVITNSNLTVGPSADLILVADPYSTNCTLMRVTQVDKAQRLLTIAPGQYPEYNNPSGWSPAHLKGANVFRIGSTTGGAIASRTFSINAATQRLQAVDQPSGATAVISNDIVNLQVQYGLSATPTDRIVTSWANPTSPFDQATLESNAAAAVTNRQRIKAIRVAVIARSSKREGNLVTQTCTGQDTAVPPSRPDCVCVNAANNFGPCAWRDSATNPAPLIDLRSATGDTEWQHYRYKVYQTIIPLRNVIWQNL